MPGKIQILSELLMKRIAAGEVIERAASVVKELLENAVDAAATEISLSIEHAGEKMIQVADNGSGMSEEDALLCVRRHATSKIRDMHDLDAIHTLGFRGEALASIGSVSRMTLTTRAAEDEEATRLDIEDGEIRDVLKVAANPGTRVRVKDLFYNVPARRKFQKTTATEIRHIMSAFRRIALAYPGIRFTLYLDDQRTLDLPASSLKERIHDLLGAEKTTRLVSFDKQIGALSMHGFVSRPGEFRRTRDDQYFFLNRRAVQHKSLIHSVLSAYGPRMDGGEYPAYLIYLEMDPRFVDVNVHPTKNEVRFADEKFIHDALHRVIRDTLRTPQSAPDLKLVSGRKWFAASPPSGRALRFQDPGQLTLDVQKPSVPEDTHPGAAFPADPPALWQVHNRYLFSQIKSGITIIDQHAAHERILFEWALGHRDRQSGLSQQLLFPQTVQLAPDDFEILVEMLPFLEKIGFGIRDFGNLAVVIEAVPFEVKPGGERELLQEILDEYRENQTRSHDRLEAVAAAFACKAAIKSGDRLNAQEMAALIDRLFAAQEPYFCPHGRPVVINLTLDEIDKRFGR
ncbi:MAG TPA: DNA mismatch repair endonuclease MutL [bacterium]|nr:DNA mismatch repair endonuclease MutL [bacterium]